MLKDLSRLTTPILYPLLLTVYSLLPTPCSVLSAPCSSFLKRAGIHTKSELWLISLIASRTASKLLSLLCARCSAQERALWLPRSESHVPQVLSLTHTCRSTY